MSFWENFMEGSYILSLAVATLYGVPSLSKRVNLSWKIYAGFLIVCLLTECFAWVLAHKQHETQWLYNWLILLEVPVTIFVFYSYTNNKTLKRCILYIAGGFIVFSLINIFYLQPDTTRLYTNLIITGGLIMLPLAIIYYVHIYSSQVAKKITEDPVFWFSTSVILYIAPLLPFYGMLNYLVDNYRSFALFYLVYVMNLFFILSNICIILCFAKLYKHQFSNN